MTGRLRPRLWAAFPVFPPPNSRNIRTGPWGRSRLQAGLPVLCIRTITHPRCGFQVLKKFWTTGDRPC